MRNTLLQIKSFLFITSFLAIASIAKAQTDPFITVWKTDNPGTSEDNQIIISGTGTDYLIEWEEVGNEANNGSETGTDEHTVTFPSAGTYRVKISGDFTRIEFNNQGDKEKILDIEQWGDIVWSSFARAFYGCRNLTVNSTDAPDLASVTNLSRMFWGINDMGGELSEWDVSNIKNMSGMFLGNRNLSYGISAWDVSSVEDMSNMFQNSRFNQDLSNWDVSHVKDMSFMFDGLFGFESDLSSWDVSSVTDMAHMFSSCFSFNSDLSGWDVSNVTNMNYMFGYAYDFTSDLSNWDVSNVTNMSFMFNNARLFNSDLSSWDVSNVTTTRGMFNNANEFNSDLSSWDVASVTDMRTMFRGADVFNSDLSSWDVSNVTTMEGMLSSSGLDGYHYDRLLEQWSYLNNVQADVVLGASNMQYCSSQEARDFLINEKGWVISGDTFDCTQAYFVTIWKTDNEGISENNQITIPAVGTEYVIEWEEVEDSTNYGSTVANDQHTLTFPKPGTYRIKIFGDFYTMSFPEAEDQLKLMEIEQWGNITWASMNSAFAGAENLTISASDYPKLLSVIDMSRMFYNAKSLNQEISNWDVSNVTNMSDLFHGASAFNQDLSTWDVSNVTNMSRMFASATAFNQDLTDWNTANVTDMDFMFWDADSFQGDISSWDVSNVNNMWGMFYSADSVNSDISNWDLSSVTNMTEMFREAKAFNQDISSWNTANVTDISGMFYEATSFDQNLGGWNLSNAGSLFEFLTNASLSAQNYDATLEGWATNANVPSDIALSAEGLIYCASDEFRQKLIDDFGWGITGDVQCSLVLEETFPAAEATNVEKNTEIYLTFDQTFEEIDFGNIELNDVSGNSVTINNVVADSLTLRIIHNGLNFNTYKVTIPENTLVSASGKVNDEIKWSFATQSILAAKDKQLATNLANYPNPFSDYTTLSFSLTEGNSFDLLVYDVKGQIVRQESYNNRASGEQSLKFERKGLPTGLYHYQIQSAKGAVSGKMMIK